MGRGKASELDVGTARCGRCAEILPDETQTFCRYCGIAFSNVPPTSTYLLMAERASSVERRRRQLRLGGLVFFFVFAFWGLSVFISALELQSSLTQLQSMRKVVFYLHDFPEFPSLEPSLKRQALATAMQAFEDHFGMPLRDIEIHEDQIPAEIAADLDGEWAQGPLPQTENAALTPMLLSFWEQGVFQRMTRLWEKDPQGRLPVLITNIPVFWDRGAGTSIETKHLSRDGLVSGLAHPGLVLVSSYRMLNQRSEFSQGRLPIHSDAEKVKHLGEYLIAHELGHALFGLLDYVTAPTTMRRPASIGHAPKVVPCLMHTDAGGGFAAWEAMRKRSLGQASACDAYEGTLSAFRLRALAIARLRNGERAEAEALHSQAILKVESTTQEWVAGAWRREHQLFLSPFHRWISGFFMF